MSKKMCVKVDLLLCQGHSVCMEEAPEVFEVIDRDEHYPQVMVKDEFPSEELWDKVRDAAQYCPNGVIKIEMIDD
jgi:ferredoxin